MGRSNEPFIEHCIGTVLSSKDFEVVDLCFHDSAVKKDVASYRVGLLPEDISWSRIKRLRTSRISLSQDELERFCCGLGYMIENIHLYHIDFRSGSWAGALDMIHEKVLKKWQGMRLPYFSELTGGEFREESPQSRLIYKLTQSPLIERSRDYISGLGATENPPR